MKGSDQLGLGANLPVAPANQRLDSWKEIASYLGRSERTVRRWEVSEELPVHRLLHEKRGSVYAYANELDAWRETRKAAIESDPTLSENLPQDVTILKPPAQGEDLSRGAAPLASLHTLLRPVYFIPAILFLLALAVGVRFHQRSEQRHWVREQAIPEISRLAANQPLAAFLLLREAEKILPGDGQVSKIAQSSTRIISVESRPAGSTVEIQDYVKPGAWFSLGATPLKNVRIPNGYFRWRISKRGAGEFVAAPETAKTMRFTLGEHAASAGMDTVPAGVSGEMIDFVGPFEYDLPAFEIDRFEVTNRQYQKFVDEEGYQKPRFWREKFIRDNKELAWPEAVSQFRDLTGRAGPSGWQGGHFPPGEADYPVSGVSWYEAAAYAVFAGKSLPTLVQWYAAAPSDLVVYRINQSNFNGRGPVRVGTFPGVGPYGTYDMSGNVREWCLNAVDGDQRFI
ncbi:MAG: SUMF1/EgtB/PvdO family nonheme iron enzyme, partial [Bryobacteraceae bacterium]